MCYTVDADSIARMELMLRRSLFIVAVLGCLGVAGAAAPAGAVPARPGSIVSALTVPAIEQAQYRDDRRREYRRHQERRRYERRRHDRRYDRRY